MRICFALLAFGILGCGYGLAHRRANPVSVTVDLPPARAVPRPGFDLSSDPAAVF
jgi:hypothetical protein